LKTDYIFWALTAVCLLTMLLNRKISIAKIFLEQLKVFKDNRTHKASPWDIFSFIICPIGLSCLATYHYKFVIEKDFAETITTAFSLIFTLLFAFEAILVNKKDSENATEREVIKETFVSIMSACVLSFVATILSIVIVCVGSDWLLKIITTIILTLAFIMIMLLLLIIKRTFKVYMRSD